MGNIPSISDVGLSSLLVSTVHFLKNLNEHDNASKLNLAWKGLETHKRKIPREIQWKKKPLHLSVFVQDQVSQTCDSREHFGE